MHLPRDEFGVIGPGRALLRSWISSRAETKDDHAEFTNTFDGDGWALCGVPEAMGSGDAVASLMLLRESEESAREWDVVRGGGWRRWAWDGRGEAREMAGDCSESLSPKMASLLDEPSLSRSRSVDDSAAIPRDGALGVSSLSYDLRVEIIGGRSMAYKFLYLLFAAERTRFKARGVADMSTKKLTDDQRYSSEHAYTSVDDDWTCALGPGSTL